MDWEVPLALGQLLGESHQVVVVIHKVPAIDLRAQSVNPILALGTDGRGRQQFVIRQRQANAIRTRRPGGTGPHRIDGGGHLRQALHLTLTLHHRVAMAGEHQLHGHLESRHRLFNALGGRLQRGMHMLRQLHLGLWIVNAIGVQELAKDVAGMEERVPGLAHACIHGLLKS